ncbi:hypothetical protein Tco_1160100, partial [Tanacetum coccineum]
METKNTSSSSSVLKEPEIRKLQMQAKIFKENSLNKLNALKSTTQLLEKQSILYQQAFAQLFGDSVRTFKFQLSQHMNNLETLLNAETLHEMDSKSALSVIKVQFKSSSIQGNNHPEHERQHSEKNSAKCTDERAALANLIANLTLDTEENKTILKQLKKANASLTQELEKCKTNLDET